MLFFCLFQSFAFSLSFNSSTMTYLCVYLCTFPTWILLSFFGVLFNIFHQIWGVWAIIFSKKLSCLFLFFCSFWHSHYTYIQYFILSHRPLKPSLLKIFLKSQFFILDNFYFSVFKFTDSFFLPLQTFCWTLPGIFCLFVSVIVLLNSKI